jgi:hypothetical protein
METYFKTFNNKFDGGFDIYLNSESKFYNAIMRRLGIDMSHKIDFREFAKILKPSLPENIIRSFD